MKKLSALAAVTLPFLHTVPATSGGRVDDPSISSTFVPAWQDLRLGAGGQITGIDFHSDGTKVIRTDTYGGYFYRSTGSCTYGGGSFPAPCWEQVITINSLPASQVDITTALKGNLGLSEFVACDSNTNVAYAYFNNKLLISTNVQSTSRTWVVAPGLVVNQNANQSTKQHGKYIACDPNNPDIAYFGTSGGLYKTSNGTSGALATFSLVSGVSTTGSIPSLIAYDPKSSTSGSPAVTQHFWVMAQNTGIYETYNGGSSFTQTSGSSAPTIAYQMKADKFSQLWVSDKAGVAIKRYVPNGTAGGGIWASLSVPNGTNAIQEFALDPTSSSSSTNHLFVDSGQGLLSYSNNNGSAWSPATWNQGGSFSATGVQPAWLGAASQIDYRFGNVSDSTMDMIEDSAGQIWAAAGIGIWNAPGSSKANPMSWTANSVGIEQLVINQITSPPGLGPFVAAWDRGVFSNLGVDTFPSVQWTNSTSKDQIIAAWGIDYAAGSTGFLTATLFSNSSFSAGAPASTTNGGSTWTAWPNNPSNFGNGGVIAASSPTNWVVISQAVNGTVEYTTNGGASWGNSAMVGCSGRILNSFFNNRQPLAADRVTTDKFYVIDEAHNVCASTDGGATFALVRARCCDGAAYRDILKAVPGNAGNLFFSVGVQTNSHPADTHLWKSTNSGMTWAKITSLKEVIVFGFGAPKPTGSGYPAIYAYGWHGGAQGVYASFDGGSTWSALNVPSSNNKWPLSSIDHLTDLTGDQNVYGRVYVGFLGSGAAYIDTQDACPWVNFSNINPNASLTGTVTLTARHSGLVPVTSVQFQVDGTNIGPPQTGQGTYTVSWNTGDVATGSHTLSVVTTGNGCTGIGSKFAIPITTD